MAIIQEEIELTGSKGKIKKFALFDSGATYSCIEESLAKKLEMFTSLPKPKIIKTAEKNRKLIVKFRVSIDFKLNGYIFSDEFIVIPNLSEKVIIGALTLEKWHMKLDFKRRKIIIDPEVTELRLL